MQDKTFKITPLGEFFVMYRNLIANISINLIATVLTPRIN